MSREGAYAKGKAKREEILALSLDVVARHGYGKASLRELATAVDLTQAGVLHYFESKEELFTEILRERDETDWDSRLAEANPTDIPEAFLNLLAHNADVPGLVQLYVHLAAAAGEGAGPAHDFFQARYQKIRTDTAACARALQEEGRLDPTLDAEAIGRIIPAVADGLQNQWLLDPGFDVAAHVRLVFQAFGLASPSRPEGSQA